MTKSVKIQVRTKINYENKTNELLKHQYNGTQYLRNNNSFLSYRDDSKQEMGVTWTIIKWNENEIPIKVTLIRHGDTRVKNIFQEGYKHISGYHSFNGIFEMEILTKSISLIKRANGGNINLNYNLKLNNQIIGDYILDINYIFD